MCDLTYRAFEIADRYRVTVFVLSDAYIGQMMEPVELPREIRHGKRKPWALNADAESRENLITSIYMSTARQSRHNWNLKAKYERIEAEIADWQEVDVDDAELLFVAYGISARLALSAVHALRNRGIRAGLLRLRTLFPFPSSRLAELGSSGTVSNIAVVELSDGMMAADVELAVPDSVGVHRLNWLGGEVPATDQILERVAELMRASGSAAHAARGIQAADQTRAAQPPNSAPPPNSAQATNQAQVTTRPGPQ
jgi:pyruvate/2-oxoacid:ferredoxin oxidoreductase alpha subunit